MRRQHNWLCMADQEVFDGAQFMYVYNIGLLNQPSELAAETNWLRQVIAPADRIAQVAAADNFDTIDIFMGNRAALRRAKRVRSQYCYIVATCGLRRRQSGDRADHATVGRSRCIVWRDMQD